MKVISLEERRAQAQKWAFGAWRGMRTAPKTGVMFLAYLEYDDETHESGKGWTQITVYWDAETARFEPVFLQDARDSLKGCRMVRWTSLPEPPK